MSALLALMIVGQSCLVQQQAAYQPVQYQANYAQQAYLEKTVFVAVESPADYYAGLVGQAQRAEQRKTEAQQATASTDARIEQLTRAIEAMQKRIDASEPALPSHPGQQVPSPPLPSLGAAAEAVPPPPTIAQASTSVAARKGNGPGLALLVAKCGACHAGAAQKGRGFKILAADGSLVRLDRVSLENIDAEIASGRMPKASSNLTLREYVTIREFLAEQASGLALVPAGQKGKKL